MLNLRNYQRASIDAMYNWFSINKSGNPLIVLPTGSGKSIVIAAFIKEAIDQWPQTRVLILTHVRELIEQGYLKMKAIWPEAPVGIYSAGLKRRDAWDKIIYAGIQSVHKKAWHLGHFDLVVVDEAHLISHKDQGMYRTFLAEAKKINPALRVIGLTATPFRTGHGSIACGEDAIFHDVAYQVSMLYLIEQGYLSKLITKRTETQIDTGSVGTRNGEFIPGQLERAADQEDVTRGAIDECLTFGADRKKWLVFCSGVAHAEHVAEALNARGVATGCVTGKTPAAKRDGLIADFKSGRLRALSNANVLTTGFDVPDTDMLVLLRPTKSPGLFVQMVGRGSRIAPGKSDCLILDFAGNTERHGPVDMIEAWTPEQREAGSAPVRECPECSTLVHISILACPTCGYLFPPPEIKQKHDARASDAPILSTDKRVERAPVTSVQYQEWEGRNNGKITMRVDYYNGFQRLASEWVCFEHTGYPKDRAVSWWIRRAPMSPVPRSCADAVMRSGDLARPTAIYIDTTAKYPEVTNYEWFDPDATQQVAA